VQWWVEFRARVRVYAYPSAPGGRRRPFRDEADAREALTLIRAEVARGTPLAVALEAWLPSVSEETFLLARAERWLEHLRAQVQSGERSPTYVEGLETYVRHPGYWAQWWSGREVHGITYGELEDWSTWLAREGGAIDEKTGKGRGLSSKTRRQVLGAFRTFLRWLERRQEIDDVPQFPAIEVDEYLPTMIDLETQDSIIAAIPEEQRGAFLAARLGLRPGEIVALNVQDFRNGCLIVSKARKGQRSDSPIRGTKNRRVRVVEVDPELEAWIAKHRGNAIGAAPLFVNHRGETAERRWIGKALRQEWKRAADQVGVKVKLYEGTKHSSATAARRRGVPLEAIQAALGHSDSRSTERYARLAPQVSASVLRPKK
jgi:integrase